MDKVIPKKRFSKQRILLTIGIGALLLIIIFGVLVNAGKSKLNVSTERITISEVTKGPFQEFIPVNGVVLPVTTIYLDATEGGRVDEIFVEDGAIMKKDRPILKLINTDLELSLANQETAVFDVLTQMQNTKNNSQQNSIRILNQMADVDNDLIEAERLYKMNKKLYQDSVIAKQDFIAVENKYNYQLRRKKLTEETLKQDTLSVAQQLSQMKESYSRLNNTLQLMRRKVEDLIVKAPVDGQLTSLDAEVGQLKNKGERLGQIDVLTGFKVRADIDEHYISRIFIGLKGEFTISNETYKVEIKKVFTQVTNGRFQVDMQFTGKIPQGIRRGQTLQIRLALSDETTAVLLPKGGFFQETGGNWIFKMTKSGSTAFKTDIQLGRQNPEYYEVLEGLQPGDKVVTSSYENYGQMEELVLKK
ncbi:MAG: HlyD family efflux transporter periplasmic adaptor subunit [Bacteroidia bacterium]